VEHTLATVQLDEVTAGVRVLTLNRPQARNTMNEELVGELAAAVAQVDADEACRVLVLTGSGSDFCAGLDLNGFGDEDAVAREGPVRRTYTRQVEIARLAQSIHHLRQPVIAAVNGAAAGGGLALALASDIRYCTSRAIFAVSFIRAGYSACDIGTSWLLPRIVGAGRAHELMLTGRRFGPDEALEIGLVTAVVDPSELLGAAVAKAAEIQLNPPLSVQLTKQGMWRALEMPSFDMAIDFENRQQVITALTEDRREATQAFLAKRPARYHYR
jgi:enoyl-CoA hydratase/carnithine racemase